MQLRKENLKNSSLAAIRTSAVTLQPIELTNQLGTSRIIGS